MEEDAKKEGLRYDGEEGTREDVHKGKEGVLVESVNEEHHRRQEQPEPGNTTNASNLERSNLILQTLLTNKHRLENIVRSAYQQHRCAHLSLLVVLSTESKGSESS